MFGKSLNYCSSLVNCVERRLVRVNQCQIHADFILYFSLDTVQQSFNK